MARDWGNTDLVRYDILKQMAKHGINAAEIPMSEWMERRGDEHVWVVNLHVKVIRTSEFDVEGEGLTLPEALRNAYLGLCREPVRTQGR